MGKQFLSALGKTEILTWLWPDAKSQVTSLYEAGQPSTVDTIVLATQ